MTPTGIRLKVVRERLGHAEKCLQGLRSLPTSSLEEFLSDPRNAWSAKTLIQEAIQAIFDTARHLAARGFGVGQLEYRQVVEYLAEQGLVSEATGRVFDQVAGYRNRLVHHYEGVVAEELFGLARDHLGDLEKIIAELREGATRLADQT